jgi:hypothetical protein
MPIVQDLPAPLLRAIADDPDEAEHWHALADWLFVHARDNEAVAVRGLWRTLRENLACASLETTLADVARNSAALAAIARQGERPAEVTPPV